MALCVMNPIETSDPKINKCALKLLGIGHFDLTDEEILECVAMVVEPSNIEALLFDTFNNYYILFLCDIDATCSLIGKKIEYKSYRINFYPLLECYVIDNVYPSLRNEELRDIFRTFGNVFSVSNHHLVPNSSKFSHVLSGKREITFLLPGEELEMYIPINVAHPPYSFNARKFCFGCLTEGHSILKCPDIEEDKDLPEMKYADSDSDGELEALIKSENIDFETAKVEDFPSDALTVDETSKQREEPETVTVNPEKVDEIKKDDTMEDVSQEDKHLKSATLNTDPLTKVVSTSNVCRFTPGINLTDKRHFVKRPVALLPPLAEELINEVCGPAIIEANVFKQLVLTDGRLKTEIIKFAYDYLDKTDELRKLMKKVRKCCFIDGKYASLQGQFSDKVKLILEVLRKSVATK